MTFLLLNELPPNQCLHSSQPRSWVCMCSRGGTRLTIDESECYDLAQQQSDVNPQMGAPAAPCSEPLVVTRAKVPRWEQPLGGCAAEGSSAKPMLRPRNKRRTRRERRFNGGTYKKEQRTISRLEALSEHSQLVLIPEPIRPNKNLSPVRRSMQLTFSALAHRTFPPCYCAS